MQQLAPQEGAVVKRLLQLADNAEAPRPREGDLVAVHVVRALLNPGGCVLWLRHDYMARNEARFELERWPPKKKFRSKTSASSLSMAPSIDIYHMLDSRSHRLGQQDHYFSSHFLLFLMCEQRR